MTGDDLLASLPFLLLLVGAVLVIALARPLRAEERAWMLLAATVASAAAALAALQGGGPDGFGGVLRRDGASAFATILVGLCAAVTLVLGVGDRGYDRREGARASGLVLLCASGAVLVASSGDLFAALLGLALLTVPLGMLGRSRQAVSRGTGRSAPLRRGAIAPLLFAAGTLLVLADTGSTRIGALGATSSPLGQAGIALVLAALAQAAALVPFHVLAPEIDATAPAPMVAFVSTVGKVGAFALLLRAAGTITASGVAEPDWRASIAVLAALTMTVGVLVALARTSLRRIVAFATIAQAGTLTVALASGVVAGPAIGFGLATLVALAFGAHAIIAELGGDPHVDDLRGLARRRPVLAVALALFMLGLAGLPPTAAFLARVALFEAALGAQLAWLVIVGAVSTVVAAVWCFRVIAASLVEDPAAVAGRTSISSAVAVAAAAAVLFSGVFPGPLREALVNARF
ncbi:MAG TPA: proton-conducting transporter membrane subunit [Candidatus Limnocylindria bacterium]|jgi:NADH-quinone oxidoreductase subunit N